MDKIPVIVSDEKILRYQAFESPLTLFVARDWEKYHNGELREYEKSGGAELAYYRDISGPVVLEIFWHAGRKCIIGECHITESSKQKRFTRSLTTNKRIEDLALELLKEGYRWAAEERAKICVTEPQIELAV